MILRIALGVGVTCVNNNIYNIGINNAMINNVLGIYKEFGIE